MKQRTIYDLTPEKLVHLQAAVDLGMIELVGPSPDLLKGLLDKLILGCVRYNGNRSNGWVGP